MENWIRIKLMMSLTFMPMKEILDTLQILLLIESWIRSRCLTFVCAPWYE